MTDDPGSNIIDFARRRAERDRAADFPAIDIAANAIVDRLIAGEELHEFVVQGDEGDESLVEVADPLDLIMSEFFGHFGPKAGSGAIRVALEAHTAIGDRRGGCPPRAVTAAGKALEPFMPGRGNAAGKGSHNPDWLGARDRLWVMNFKHLTARGLKPMAIYRHLAKETGLTVGYVKKHLATLLRKDKVTVFLDDDW